MKQIKTIFLLLVLSVFCNSCEKINPIDKITGAFDEAIDKLEQQSISWQQTLRDLENEIAQDVSDIIREDLQNFVEVSIATTGVELRCNMDYFILALQKEIRRLKLKYLIGIGQSANEVTYSPSICQVTPSPIEDDTEFIEFYGYDLYKDEVEIFLEYEDGTQIDIKENTDFQSRYQFTILIGGSHGITPDFRNRKIVIECKNCVSNKFVSEVGFNMPSPNVRDLHHFINPINGHHIFVPAIDAPLAAWSYQGIIGKVIRDEQPYTIPMYRYFHSSYGYLYTTNYDELGGGSFGYILEFIAFYVYPNQVHGTVPLYRYGNIYGYRTYRTDYSIFGDGNAEWTLEKIEGYILPE